MNTNEEIKIYRDLMGANTLWAGRTRDMLNTESVFMLNLIGSPGSGKTTLLEKAVHNLGNDIRFAVLEGDVETINDSKRLHALGVTVSQLITGGACHLEAKLVHHALLDLPLRELDMVVVENVGNLVCPAEFDIGENAKIAVLSVTEGEDKPLKYPLLFREASTAIVTKTDLLPHLNFDLQLCLGNIRNINPAIQIFEISSVCSDGMARWIHWIRGILGQMAKK